MHGNGNGWGKAYATQHKTKGVGLDNWGEQATKAKPETRACICTQAN